MKGWLLIQPYAEYLEATDQSGAERPETFILLNRESSSTESGAFPISYAIGYPESIKVFGEHEGTQIGATFNTRENVPDGDNGTYEIKGSRLESAGTFVNVAPKKETEFLKFFICHSNTANGLQLRWEVGLDELVEGEMITY